MISPQELIDRVLAAATFDDCFVIVQDSTEANLRWANNTLTTNGTMAKRDVTVIAFIAVDGGMAAGTASRTDLALDEIPTILKEAETAARAAGAADDAAPLLTSSSHGDWNADQHLTGPNVFANITQPLGDMLKRAAADDIELFGYAEHRVTSAWMGSSGGVRVRLDQPVGRIEMTGKAEQRQRSTWEGRATSDFTNVDIAEVDTAIRTKLAWQARRIDLPPGRYDTVAPSGVVADLMTYALWLADARSAMEGRSAYADKTTHAPRLGEQIASLPLNLRFDPSDARVPGSPVIMTTASSPFASVFDNGQRRTAHHMFKAGVLESLIHTRATATKYDHSFTPMPDNAIIEAPGGTGSALDLAKDVENGLLLNTMWYIRMVDPSTMLLTGLTRDGIYQVRNGEVVGAVNNFRWNESPLGLLSRLTAVGSPEHTQPREWAGDIDRMFTPAMRFADFNMSTVSPGN